jgi:thiol reductant ABC exporter CydC subunit
MIAARLGKTPLGRAAIATRSRWRLFGVSVLLATGTVLAAVGLLTASGYLISRAAQRPEILSLTVAIVSVRFFGISRALLRYGERLASHDLAFRALTDLRGRFFERLIPLVPAGIEGSRRADLMSRFVGDVDRLQDLYLRALSPPLVAIVCSLFCVLLASVILPLAGLVLAGMLLLGGVVAPALIRRAARKAGRRQASARGHLAGDLHEIALGGAEIAVAGREEHWLDLARTDDARLVSLQQRDAMSGGLAEGLGTMLAVGAAVAVTAASIPAVNDGRLSGVMLAALALLAMASFEAITPLGQAAAVIDATDEAAARLEQVTERPVPVVDPAEPHPIPPGGAVRLEQVTFSYRNGGRPLLDRASIELEPGEAIALTGPSGIGKSTLAELMIRFRDPDAGRVTIGGCDLRDLEQDRLREAIRLAPQDAYMFNTTIAENVKLGRPDADPERIFEALAEAGLEDWVNSLPDGLDSLIGENGSKISGGQRQRIAAARVFLSRARFLIFDEPTAHLDPEGAAALERCLIGRRDRGCGILVITHALADPGAFDRVLELRDGKFREIPV